MKDVADHNLLLNMKIQSSDSAGEIFDRLRNEKRRIILCHWTHTALEAADLLQLEAAGAMGDYLVVCIELESTTDNWNSDPRIHMLSTLAVVDAVLPYAGKRFSGVDIVSLIQPSTFCIIEPGRVPTPEEMNALEQLGTEIHHIQRPTVSDNGKNGALVPELLPERANQWLDGFRQAFSFGDLLSYLNACRDIRVLVIGEVIIDEYVYCQGLGKSNKDPILAFNYERSDIFGGGSLAVANHLAGFCNDVSLISYLGDSDRCEAFTRTALHENVTPCFMTRSDSPTVRKKRYVDSHTLAKVFEVYYMEDTPPLYEEQIALVDAFEEIVQGYDLVIVSDFGHGMMSPPVQDALVDSDRFLAINTQANAGNRGFNTISKYSRADYVCLAGHEVELETRLKHAPFDELIHEVEKSIDCPRFTITVGKHGTLHNAARQSFIQVPAFATKVTDRVGAGDAVLAISSLLAYQNAPWDMVGLISNLAGREMVERMGNSGSINRSSLENSLAKLLC